MKYIYMLMTIEILLFFACDKEKVDSTQVEDASFGCITGKITIFNTGSVTDAYVQLSISENSDAIYSKLIASDGDYTIDNVEEGTYFFSVYKQGFIDTLFNEAIRIQPQVLNDGNCRQMDWAISSLPPHLYVVEVNTENVISTLDFGNSDDMLYFQIYNNSENTYKWWSNFEDVKLTREWLNTMTYSLDTVTLTPNETKNITLAIDRTNLNTGQNTANILIDSDNGGGWVLSIVAVAP